MSVLADTRFVIIGCGGLGCPVIMALSSAGATQFLLIDHDVVERHNLHRQILYVDADHGRSKAEAARDWIVARLPHARVETRRERVIPDAQGLPNVHFTDVVVECSDQPELKFFVSDACARQGVRAVIGGAQGFTGHVFAQGHNQACLRCLFEQPPPPELSQDCASAGVFSTTTGLVGQWMAAAAIELATLVSESSFFANCDARSPWPRRLAIFPRSTCVCRTKSNALPYGADHTLSPACHFDPGLTRAWSASHVTPTLAS